MRPSPREVAEEEGEEDARTHGNRRWESSPRDPRPRPVLDQFVLAQLLRFKVSLSLRPHPQRLHQCQLPTMFGELGAAPAAARTDNRRPAEGADDTSELTKLNRLFAQLLLQHEDHNRGNLRDQNIVAITKKESQFSKSLEAALQDYDARGKTAKDQAKDQNETYTGNPSGKKPDAMLRSVVHYIAAAYQQKKQEVDAAAAQGENPEKALAALAKIVEAAVKARDMSKKFTATRCFRVETKDSEGAEVHKWIFACNSMGDVMRSFETLRENRCLQAAAITLDWDHAPRSQAAKSIDSIVFKGGEAKGPKRRRR